MTKKKERQPSTVPFKFRVLGLSPDRRTNVWAFTCGCGKQFTPRSTMRAEQEVQCPACGRVEVVNYNNQP